MDPLINQTLNHYKIISLLGEGGMGAVYKAFDVTLERYVAVKVMHPNLARQPGFQERLLQEARSAARLDHPGIVRVFDFGFQDPYFYIVMEFIPGDNLRSLLTNLKNAGQWIPLQEAVALVQQVSLAIDYTHHQGIVHRDIKPDNIMLKLERSASLPFRPVLTDLGLAKLIESQGMTQAGTTLGTPAYMSPEQALGEKIEVRSDVYSLGILLYELCVGQVPFQVNTITEAIRCHTQVSPPPPRTLRPDIPESLERIILSALEKDPARRFPNAAALASALAELDAFTWQAETEPGGKTDQQFQAGTGNREPIAAADGAGPVTEVERQVPLTAVDNAGPGTAVESDVFASKSGRETQAQSSTEAGTPPLEGMAPFFSELFKKSPAMPYARLEAAFRETYLAVEPGSIVRTSLQLNNLCQESKTFNLSLIGAPLDWVKGLVNAVQLGPFEKREFELAFQPPRIPQSRSGEYPVMIRISTETGEQVAEVHCSLMVGAYFQYQAEMEPTDIQPGSTALVVVHNLGNKVVTYEINLESDESAISLSPSQSTLQVGEGLEAASEFQAFDHQRRWIGGAKKHPIRAQISSGGGNDQIINGNVISRAVLPPWIWLVLLVGLCLFLPIGPGGRSIFSNLIIPSTPQPTKIFPPTFTPIPTEKLKPTEVFPSFTPTPTNTITPTITLTFTPTLTPTPTRPLTILWDLSKGPRQGNSGEYSPEGVYSNLKALLAAEGITVVSNRSDLSQLQLEKYRVMVISVLSAYLSPYSDAEASIIQNFVSQGGSLLLMGDIPGSPNTLYQVASRFNVEMHQSPGQSTISNFQNHPIFIGVKQIEYWSGGTSIGADSTDVVPVAFGNGGTAIAVIEKYPGRIAIIGDSNFCDNRGLPLVDNNLFTKNLFRWLSFLN